MPVNRDIELEGLIRSHWHSDSLATAENKATDVAKNQDNGKYVAAYG